MLLAALATGTATFALLSTAGLFGLIPDSVAEAGNLSLPWLMLAGAALAIWKKLSYRIALPVLALSGSLLVYLAWDGGPPVPPLVLPKLAAEDSPAAVTYRWLLKSGPGSRSKNIPPTPLGLLFFPPDRKDWPAFVKKHRHAFEEAWAADTLAREWIDTMAAHPPDGIYPVGGADAPTLDYTALRHSTKVRWAHAHLLLLDSKGDEAVRELVPMLRTGYHLQRGGISLLTQTTASVLLKGTYDRLEMAVESGRLSPAAKTEVITALRLAPSVPDNFARAFLGEEILARTTITQVSGENASTINSVASAENSRFSAHRVLGRFLFNPVRTQREYLAFLNASCRLAQERQFKAAEQVYEEFEARLETKRLKNPVGQLLISMLTPAFVKVSEALWQAEDQRIVLLQRLEAPNR